jgi:hypothetical protein
VYHNTLCTKYNYTLTRFYVIILSVLHKDLWRRWLICWAGGEGAVRHCAEEGRHEAR